MKKIGSLIKRHFNMPGASKGARILRSLSPTEALLFGLFGLLLIGSALGIVWQVNSFLLEEVPVRGGSLTEGIVGAPRFINPLLSFSSSDRDMTTLVYAGLVKKDSSGEIIPELAERFEVSEDGTEYIFTIREDAFFHDGTRVTADDIIFTYQLVRDDRLSSPKRANWNGVTAEKIDEQTVRFTLEEAFAPFLETASLGILPAHIWGGVDVEQVPFSQRNIEPIGAGPYRINKILRKEGGVPGTYILESFSDYVLGEPYITSLTFKIYENYEAVLEAYRDGEVESISGVSPMDARELFERGARIETPPLSRVFSIFFNQNKAPIFTDSALREALESALDKERLIDEVFHGFATATSYPFPPNFLGGRELHAEHAHYDEDFDPLAENDSLPAQTSDADDAEDENEESEEVSTSTPAEDLTARDILLDGGWEFDVEKGLWTKGSGNDIKEASFTLTVPNLFELVELARLVSREWEKIGIRTEVITLAPEELREGSIRPREYEALVFGQVVNRPVDLYAFWHSSQRNDPGLNVALYANVTADRALSSLRTATDIEEVQNLMRVFAAEIEEDNPAVELFSPELIYIIPEKVKGLEFSYLRDASERFSDIHNWFIETNKQWNFLRKERN